MAPPAADRSEYELERDRRVAENKRKMEELGLSEAAATLAAAASSKPAGNSKRQKRAAKADAVPKELVERRVSAREKKEVNYSELEPSRAAREPKAAVDNTQRIQGITLDEGTAEQLRLELAGKRSGGGSSSSKSAKKPRGPIDSGKGVRIQGGKVYDSKHGVTCHWCRQKTLEDHVTCTNTACGNGRRMPLSFCAKCLKNRHGEDFAAAEASDSWWCPACRGSCGLGCVTCCNCGPCRKKAGLEPTHQVVKLARDAGFDNVHDYLVHLVTGESAGDIAERKLQFPWGAWLKNGGDGAAGAGAAGAGGNSSEASEQTGGGCCGSDGGAAAHGHHHHRHSLSSAEQQQQEPGSSAGAAGGDVGNSRAGAAGKKDQRPSSAAAANGGGSMKDFFRTVKASSAAAAAAGKGKKGKAVAVSAAADAKEEEEQAAAVAADVVDVADDGPMLSSQDMRLSRKQRMMQCLGLAPVTVVTN